jgi:hypothetical protein
MVNSIARRERSHDSKNQSLNVLTTSGRVGSRAANLSLPRFDAAYADCMTTHQWLKGIGVSDADLSFSREKRVLDSSIHSIAARAGRGNCLIFKRKTGVRF